MSGKRDDRRNEVSGAALSRRAASQPSNTGKLISIKIRSGVSNPAIDHALFTIQSDGDSITAPFETARQHVAVYLIILYQQDLLIRIPESSLGAKV